MTNIKIKLIDGREMNATLDEENAPITVENFLKLVDNGFYNGLIFHRVIPKFMIQGGGMDPSLCPKDAKSIKGEFLANGINNTIQHKVGTISMARTNVPDSASSQFFICVEDCAFLDGQYAAFGQLSDEESIKVAVDISKVKTVSVGYYQDVPYEPIIIQSIVRA
ncbi:MAG: peptidylprolyl isomerase [Clostridia bacterium]|nr:peptidylprolyl isomerase [Clostridia bacterium]MDE7329435.1 peptidylprolyl isomerase [Clostridia bacterium]